MSYRVAIGLATSLVAVAAAVGGCGEVPASHPASAPHPGAAPAGKPSREPGVASATSASPGAPPGCQGSAAAGPAGMTLTVTLAGNAKTFCLRVGDRLRLYLRGTQADPWLPAVVGGGVLAPVRGAGPAVVEGITSASYAAVRAGRVTVTAVRPPCGVAEPYGKGDLEPAFPVPETHPGRSCPAGHLFSASVIVLR